MARTTSFSFWLMVMTVVVYILWLLIYQEVVNRRTTTIPHTKVANILFPEPTMSQIHSLNTLTCTLLKTKVERFYNNIVLTVGILFSKTESRYYLNTKVCHEYRVYLIPQFFDLGLFWGNCLLRVISWVYYILKVFPLAWLYTVKPV